MGGTTSSCQKHDATVSQTESSRPSHEGTTRKVDHPGAHQERPVGVVTVGSSTTEETSRDEGDGSHNNSHNETLKALRAGLDQMELNYMVPENREIIILIVSQRCGQVNYVLDAEYDSDSTVVIQALAPLAVPADRRTQAAVFFTYANYGIKVGNFEMDMRDGEVRFKTSCQFGDSHLSPEMVMYMMRASVALVDQFIPALMEVLYAGKDPKQAYFDVMNGAENKTSPETALEQ